MSTKNTVQKTARALQDMALREVGEGSKWTKYGRCLELVRHEWPNRLDKEKPELFAARLFEKVKQEG